VNGTELLVLVLHVPALVAIIGFEGIVLVVLTELSPGFEVVPEFVEFVHIGQGGVCVTNSGNRLFLRPPRVTDEHLVIGLVEGLVGEFTDFRDFVIEGESRVVSSSLCGVAESLVGGLDLEPHRLQRRGNFTLDLVGMVLEGEFPVGLCDVFFGGLEPNFLHAEQTVQIAELHSFSLKVSLGLCLSFLAVVFLIALGSVGFIVAALFLFFFFFNLFFGFRLLEVSRRAHLHSFFQNGKLLLKDFVARAYLLDFALTALGSGPLRDNNGSLQFGVCGHQSQKVASLLGDFFLSSFLVFNHTSLIACFNTPSFNLNYTN